MVKICGITRAEDAVAAVDAGADALGFNFYLNSPRYIDPALAGEIDSRGALRVGIFVDATPAAATAAARLARLDVLQLYGGCGAAEYVPFRVWKAYRVTAGWTPPADTGAEAVLLDGPAPGTGAAFDWQVARKVQVPFLLAGGLDADNVAEAIRVTRPWGVDACSRLESAPGIKDSEKVARFIQAARTALL
jgi:phosphoribosylanthranilate isomerase